MSEEVDNCGGHDGNHSGTSSKGNYLNLDASTDRVDLQKSKKMRECGGEELKCYRDVEGTISLQNFSI